MFHIHILPQCSSSEASLVSSSSLSHSWGRLMNKPALSVGSTPRRAETAKENDAERARKPERGLEEARDRERETAATFLPLSRSLSSRAFSPPFSRRKQAAAAVPLAMSQLAHHMYTMPHDGACVSTLLHQPGAPFLLPELLSCGINNTTCCARILCSCGTRWRWKIARCGH